MPASNSRQTNPNPIVLPIILNILLTSRMPNSNFQAQAIRMQQRQKEMFAKKQVPSTEGPRETYKERGAVDAADEP
jgi:hypothetical protein